MATLEDLDRRVTALEKAAETEKNIVRAVAQIVAESEKRVRADLKVDTQRLETRIVEEVSASEQRMVDLLNDRFDAVMAALDRRHNPPK